MPREPKLFAIPIAIVITAVIGVAIYWNARRHLTTGDGRPVAGFVLHAPGGNVVVIVDRVSSGRNSANLIASGVRIVALDASTGHQLALRVLDDFRTNCWPAAANRIWCVQQDGPALLETPSLATVATTSELLAKVASAPR